MRKVFPLFFVLLLFSGCMLPLQPPPTLPDFSLFEEGDIFITTNGNTQSWFFALAARDSVGNVKSPYSHAEMVFRNREGEMMLGGVFGGSVQAESLVERFPKFYRIAVFRANAPLAKRKKAGRALWKMINDPQVSDAEFDYSMSYRPGRTDSLFCAGLVNESCRQAGLEYPFGLRKWTANGLTEHAEQVIGTKLQGLLDLNSLYHSDTYYLILEWQNDQIDNDTVQLSRKIILYVLDQYEKGWKLRTNDDFYLFLALGNPSPVERQFVRLKISLSSFSRDVISMWHRLARRDNLEGMDEREKDALLEAVFDRYQNKYFYFAGAVGTGKQQL